MAEATKVLSAAQTRDQRAREEFERYTADHQMTVLRDDGLYRHVRFRDPSTVMYLYDLITWPGNLVICGDVEAFHFARISDMFEFFVPEDYSERWPINPHYWAQKLQGVGGRRQLAEAYSTEAYEEHVREWANEVAREMESVRDRCQFQDAVERDLLTDPDSGEHGVYTEESAHRLLNQFEHNGHTIYDPWDWNIRDWTPQYLFACWAIVRGIQRYRKGRDVA